VFVGEVFSGAASRIYIFDAPDPGTYYFRCDVHPQVMTGTAVVEEGAGEASGAE
jgi:plastocyanin